MIEDEDALHLLPYKKKSRACAYFKMVAIHRRDVLWGATTLFFSSGTKPLSLEQCVSLICHSTPTEFRRAVSSSSCFLFRGEDTRVAKILSPLPDLMDESTYGEPEAVVFFRCLEDLLLREGAVSRPSTGHIGTATLGDAKVWGDAVSIWPLGDSFSYVWPKDSKLFYPGTCGDEAETFVIDEGLQVALETGKEILFWSSRCFSWRESSFLAVPDSFSEKLREALEQKEYGL